jgi:hypothetical protein
MEATRPSDFPTCISLSQAASTSRDATIAVGTMTRRALATLVRDLIVSDSWIRRRRALDAHRCVSAVSLWKHTRSDQSGGVV